MAQAIQYLPGAEEERTRHWQEAIDTWLALYLSAKTRQVYRYHFGLFQKAIDKPLWDVTRKDVAGWRDKLIAEGKADNSVMGYVSVVSSFYKFAVGEGLTDLNPAYGVDRPKAEPYSGARWITAEEAKKILDAVDRTTVTGRRDFAMLLTMWVCALRATEIVSIRRGDLRPKAGGGIELSYRPKGGTRQTRDVPDSAWQAVKAYLADRDAELRAYAVSTGKEYKPLAATAPIFVSYSNSVQVRDPTREKHVLTGGLRYIVAGYSQAAIGRAVNPHAFRHGAGTELEKLTNSLLDVQELLGHKHISTTQAYIHRTKDGRGAFGDMLARSVTEPPP